VSIFCNASAFILRIAPAFVLAPEADDALPDLLLIARVAGRAFAVPAAIVERVLQMVEVTPMLGGSNQLLGLINLHGSVVPVVNVRRVLGAEPAPPSPDQHLVVLSKPRQYALWIDKAEHVIHARAADFEAVTSPDVLSGLVVRVAGQVLPVLSGASLDPGPLVGVATG
jgi:chemotaxis signal transduction protein